MERAKNFGTSKNRDGGIVITHNLSPIDFLPTPPYNKPKVMELKMTTEQWSCYLCESCLSGKGCGQCAEGSKFRLKGSKMSKTKVKYWSWNENPVIWATSKGKCVGFSFSSDEQHWYAITSVMNEAFFLQRGRQVKASTIPLSIRKAVKKELGL